MIKAATKDERFVLKLFELASAKGDPTYEIDRYEVGETMGQKQRGVDSMVRLLAQSNFVKKGSGANIYLTDNGLTLIRALRGL